MCGINGFSWKDEKLVERMNVVTRHRGPDDTGTFAADGISLGNNRLAIIDLSQDGHQPMESGDGRFVIVYNGELYNFQELKRELEGLYEFTTKSDTEVILAAYTKWGYDCVKKFNGIFGFALWDKEKKELFLGRDHNGIKPLYYYHNPSTDSGQAGKFIFSSEIKAILEHDIARKLDHEAFNHYMHLSYVPSPKTMFRGIHKLPPASYGIFRNGECIIHTYWKAVPTPGGRITHKEVRREVGKAVERQLVSDKPVGLYLSGGIDSSVVLDRERAVRGGAVNTFSVGFELPNHVDTERFNADFTLARDTAQRYATHHHEILITPGEVMDLLERAVWHLDEPIASPTAVAMFKIAQEAKQYVDVVLTGNGGDELFGGYERYRLSYAATLYQKVFPKPLRDALSVTTQMKKLNTPEGIERFSLFMIGKDSTAANAVSGMKLSRERTEHFFQEQYFADMPRGAFELHFMNVDRKTWLIDQSLMLTDKMSMASGLEARVPLLDKELVSFAQMLDIGDKVSLFNTKRILKQAFSNELPDYLLNQPKRGWFSPGAKWLRIPGVLSAVEAILSPSYNTETADFFDFDVMRRVLDGHVSKGEYHLDFLWRVLVFQLWAKRFNVRIRV